MTGDLLYIYFASLVAFLVYGWDKRQARLGLFRIPEAVLLILAGIGGAFGAACAMLIYHHKTRKTIFQILVPLFLVLTIVVDIVIRLNFN